MYSMFLPSPFRLISAEKSDSDSEILVRKFVQFNPVCCKSYVALGYQSLDKCELFQPLLIAFGCEQTVCHCWSSDLCQTPRFGLNGVRVAYLFSDASEDSVSRMPQLTEIHDLKQNVPLNVSRLWIFLIRIYAHKLVTCWNNKFYVRTRSGCAGYERTDLSAAFTAVLSSYAPLSASV